MSVFTANPNVSYTGSTVQYITEGNAVLMLDFSGSQGGGSQTGYVSRNDCAVVQAIDTSNVMNGYLTLGVFRMDGTTAEPLHVKVINGVPVSALTADKIAVSDIIEYTVFQPGASNASTFYSIVNISSKPFVPGASNAAHTYYIGADTFNIGIGYKTGAAQPAITYQGSLPMGTPLTVIYYNGYYFENISNDIAGKTNYQQQIIANCSMYASYGAAGNAAKFVYIRPKYIAPADTPGAAEFTRIVYLSSFSVNNKDGVDGVVYYPEAFDFIGGKIVTGAYGSTLLYNKMPQTAGFYKAGVNTNNELMLNITEPDPLTADITNTSIVYDKETSMTSFSKTLNTYTVTIGGVTYTTNSFSMYKYGTNGKIEEISSGNIMNNQLYPVDVFMVPANNANTSARIALLWRQA